MIFPSVHDIQRPLEGAGYQFWSGVEGALQAAWEHIVYFFVALGLWLKKHNCHVYHCRKLAWHPHPEHDHPVCKRHHPDHPKGGGRTVHHSGKVRVGV